MLLKSLLYVKEVEQLSDTEGWATVTAAAQLAAAVVVVMSAGQVTFGACASVTTTSMEQVAVFPTLSVAVHVTVVVLSGYTPEASAVLLKSLSKEMADTELQLSDAVGEPMVTVAVHVLRSVLTEAFAGQVILGASLSLTVTVNEQSSVFPASSVAVKVTVVVPSG